MCVCVCVYRARCIKVCMFVLKGSMSLPYHTTHTAKHLLVLSFCDCLYPLSTSCEVLLCMCFVLVTYKKYSINI